MSDVATSCEQGEKCDDCSICQRRLEEEHVARTILSLVSVCRVVSLQGRGSRESSAGTLVVPRAGWLA